MVVLMDGKLEGIAPKLFIDNAWPTGHRMKEHDSGFASDDANVAFSKAVLPMSSYARERLTLLAIHDFRLESFGVVNAVVASIMLHMNIMGASELLEVPFGGDSLFTVGVFLVTTMDVFGHAIYEESGTFVAAFAALTGLKRHYSTYRGYHLVGCDEVSG